MNKKLKSYWAKHVEQPASIKDIFEAMGVGFLDLEEAFALYHPCVLEKRLPSEMPMSVQEKFFRSGYITMEGMAWVMCLIGCRKCVEDKDKIGVGIKGEVTYTKIYDAYSKYYGLEPLREYNGILIDYKENFRGWMDDLLEPFYRPCLSSALREVAVRGHARGLSTTAVINDLIFMDEDLSPFALWKFGDACGPDRLRRYLHPQLVYLKASNPRFPKKYQSVWDDERERFQQQLTGIPMSTVVEQVQALSDHYEKLVEARDAVKDPKDLVSLSNAIVKTVAGLFALTRDPVYRDQLDMLKEQNKLEMLGAKSSDALGSSDVQSLAPPKVAALNAPAADVLSNESAVRTEEDAVGKETK